MLESLDSRKFLEWQIANKLGLDPDGWYQMAESTSAITNQLILLRNQMGGVDTKIDQLTKPSTFIPEGIE